MRLGQNILTFSPTSECKDKDACSDHFDPGVDWSTTTMPWKSCVVDELKSGAAVLRMMKASKISGTGSAIAAWADRQQPRNPDQYPTPGHRHPTKGVAYEWQIVLAAQTGSDLWLNVPRHAITPALTNNGTALPDFVVRLALLVKTGVDTTGVDLLAHMGHLSSLTAAQLIQLGGNATIAPLPASQRLYLEYGNENWCEESKWQKEMAAEIGNGVNKITYSAWASVQMFYAADAVFGAEAPARVFHLLRGQVGSPAITEQHLRFVNATGARLDGYAVAPYVGGSHGGTTISSMIAFLPKVASLLAAQQAKIAQFSTTAKMIAYEGGQSIFPDKKHINDQPGMGTFYTAYWKAMAPHFTGDAAFVHFGYAGGGGTWGLKVYPGEPTAKAYKWVASEPWFP